MKVFTFLCVLSVLVGKIFSSLCVNQVTQVDAYEKPIDFIYAKNKQVLPLNQVNTSFAGIVISNTQLSVICKDLFRTLKHVTYLSFAENKINKIQAGSFDKVPYAFYIQLRDNELERIEYGIFRNLDQLNEILLDNNEITEIEDEAFSNLPDLEEVNLYSNNIHAVSNKWFVNCPKLKIIDLSFNQIKTIPTLAFNEMSSYSYVKVILASNKIEKIQPGAFANFQRIGGLQLRDNKIKELPTMFGDLVNGRKIGLNKNLITCVSDDILEMLGKFKEVRLKKNPITSGCILKNETALKAFSTNFILN